MKVKVQVEYQVVKLANGLYAPRIVSRMGSCWFEKPDVYDNKQDAIDIILKKRQQHIDEANARKEEVVFRVAY